MSQPFNERARCVRAYRGGCACGAVQYRVEIDWSAAALATSGSVWESAVRPGGFVLLAGERFLSGHQFGPGSAHHFYCERCGVRAYSRHHTATEREHYSVDAKCLEARPARQPRDHAPPPACCGAQALR